MQALKPSAGDSAVRTSRQYLTFTVAGEAYAFGIARIREIIEYGRLTPIPLMPAFVRGVINLRGRVLPVIDLAARFGGPPGETTRRSCIVVVEADADADRGGTDLGFVVDTVSEVLEIPLERIEPPPAFGQHIRPDFIEGMARLDERFVVILDEHRVLSIPEMAQLSRLTQGAAA